MNEDRDIPDDGKKRARANARNITRSLAVDQKSPVHEQNRTQDNELSWPRSRQSVFSAPYYPPDGSKLDVASGRFISKCSYCIIAGFSKEF